RSHTSDYEKAPAEDDGSYSALGAALAYKPAPPAVSMRDQDDSRTTLELVPAEPAISSSVSTRADSRVTFELAPAEPAMSNEPFLYASAPRDCEGSPASCWTGTWAAPPASVRAISAALASLVRRDIST